MWIISPVNTTTYFGIVTIVVSDGKYITHRCINAQFIKANLREYLLREVVTNLDVLQTQVATALHEAVAVVEVDTVLGIRNGTIGIVLCPNGCHIAAQLAAKTCSFEVGSHRIVNLVTCNTLEEEGNVKALPVSRKVQTVSELRERVTDVGLVVLVNLAVIVKICIDCITRLICCLVRQTLVAYVTSVLNT